MLAKGNIVFVFSSNTFVSLANIFNTEVFIFVDITEANVSFSRIKNFSIPEIFPNVLKNFLIKYEADNKSSKVSFMGEEELLKHKIHTEKKYTHNKYTAQWNVAE